MTAGNDAPGAPRPERGGALRVVGGQPGVHHLAETHQLDADVPDEGARHPPAGGQGVPQHRAVVHEGGEGTLDGARGGKQGGRGGECSL